MNEIPPKITREPEILMLSDVLKNLSDDTDKLTLVLQELPKYRLVRFIKYFNRARRDKYGTPNKEYKYGDLQRGMTGELLHQFFKSITSKNARISFLIQYFYALRIGELQNITPLWGQGLLKIWNEKKDRWDHLPIQEPTIPLLKEYEEMIPLNTDHLQKIFREAVDKLQKNYVYHIDALGFNHRLYTTHSIRHTAITKFMNYLNNPIKVMRFSRHRKGSNYGTLETYISYRMDELKRDLEECFKKDYELI